MKKKVFLLIMSLSMIMLAWGCGKKDVASELNSAAEDNATTNFDKPADTTTDTVTGAAEETTAEVPVREAYEVNDFITLGEYKGVKVTYDKLQVTDADVDAAIEDEVSANAKEEEVKDRAVENGDIVNIDYEGLKGGVAFEGGTATDYDLTIGSGRFIEGFEEGLIGHKIGEKVALNLTFPKDYSSADLAGQAVVFNVTINSIKVSVAPELNDEYVKNNTDYDTVAAYKDATRADLVAENELTMKDSKISSILKTVVDNSKISSYPQTLLDYYSYELESYYLQYAQMYGMDLSSFLEANSLSEEKYNEQKKTYAENRASQELVLNAVIKAEKLALTDKEYADGLAGYMKDYNCATEEEFYKNYAKEEQVRESLLWEKAMNFLLEQSVES